MVVSDNFPALDSLVAPISADQPTGPDLRENHSPTSSYQQLRDARGLARNQERSALANGEAQYFAISAWDTVLDLAPSALASESKDLEVCAWYIEALTRRFGFSGLAFGFELAAVLISNFGAALHPLPDEDGLITQVGPLVGLNGFGADGPLVAPIKSIALTDATPPGPVATWQCEQIFEVDRIKDPEKRAARLRQGVLGKDVLDGIVAQTTDSDLLQICAEIQSAIKAYDAFQEAIDAYSVDEPQPTQKIKEVLATCQQTLNYLAGDRLKLLQASAEPAEKHDEETTEQAPTEKKGRAVNINDLVIEDRVMALNLLKEIGSYFRRTEPHSPISYSIEQIIRWSGMPLSDLIQELIPDDGARKQFKNLAGMMAEQKSK